MPIYDLGKMTETNCYLSQMIKLETEFIFAVLWTNYDFVKLSKGMQTHDGLPTIESSQGLRNVLKLQKAIDLTFLYIKHLSRSII